MTGGFLGSHFFGGFMCGGRVGELIDHPIEVFLCFAGIILFRRNNSQHIQGIRHFGGIGVFVEDIGKGLLCRTVVFVETISFTQTLLGIGRITALRIIAQISFERCAGRFRTIGP